MFNQFFYFLRIPLPMIFSIIMRYIEMPLLVKIFNSVISIYGSGHNNGFIIRFAAGFFLLMSQKRIIPRFRGKKYTIPDFNIDFFFLMEVKNGFIICRCFCTKIVSLRTLQDRTLTVFHEFIGTVPVFLQTLTVFHGFH